MRLDIYLHFPAQIDPRIDQILTLATLIAERQEAMSKELDDLTAEVQAEETVEASVVTLLNGIVGRLDQAGTDPAALVALKDSIKASSDALAAAAAAIPPAP